MSSGGGPQRSDPGSSVSSSGGPIHGPALDAFTLTPTLTAKEIGGGKEAKVTAIAAYSGYLFLALDNGFVHVYSVLRVTGSGGATRSGVELLVKKKVAKKQVTQMEVILLPEDGSGSSGGGGGRSGASASPSNGSNRPPLLLALVDSKLVLLDSGTLSSLTEVGKDHSYSLFCVDNQPTPPSRSSHHPSSSPSSTAPSIRVCATQKGKKKLHLFRLWNSGVSQVVAGVAVRSVRSEVLREVPLPDSVQSMDLQGDVVAFGYKREYSLLSLSQEQVTDVPVPVEEVTPLIARCGAGELLLSTKGKMGFFVNLVGEPLPKAPLLWAEAPLALVVCGGYALAALPGENIAIASLLDQKQVQQVHLPRTSGSGSSSSSSSNSALLITTYPNSEEVYVCVTAASGSGGSEVFTLHLTSIADQIEQYMELGLANEAAALLARTGPSTQALEQFHVQAGFVLLKQLEWVDAFEKYFSHVSQAALDPRELITLFPDLITKSLPYDSQSVWRSRMGSMSDMISTALREAKLVPDKWKTKIGPHATHASLLREARLQLAQFLWNWRCKNRPAGSVAVTADHPQDQEVFVCIDTALLFLAVEFEDLQPEETDPNTYDRSASTSMDGMDHASSTSATSTSASSNNSSDSPLFPYTFRSLLFPTNSCSLHDSEFFLLKHHFYHTLALLYQSHGFLTKALSVLRDMGEGHKVCMDAKCKKMRAQSTSTAATNKKKGVKATADPSSSTLPPGLLETVSLLSSLPDQPALREFSEWVLRRSPKDGLRIFYSNPRRRKEDELDPEDVLLYLKKVQMDMKHASASQNLNATLGGIDGEYTILPSPNAAATPGSAGSNTPPSPSLTAASFDLVESYLEYLVNHQQTTESKYHTQLALSYLKKVLMLLGSPIGGPTVSSGGSGISASTRARASSMARYKPGHEPGLLGGPRLKLLRFLQRSKFYDATAVLGQLVAAQGMHGTSATVRARGLSAFTSAIPPTSSSSTSFSPPPSYSGLNPASHSTNLYEELLLLLSRLGHHLRVLQIYIFDLRDEESAANYAGYIAVKRLEAQRRQRERQAIEAARRATRNEAGQKQEDEDMEEEERIKRQNLSSSLPKSSSSPSSVPSTNAGSSSSSSTSSSSGADDLDDSDRHPGDVFLDLLDIYFSKQYETLWKEQHPDVDLNLLPVTQQTKKEEEERKSKERSDGRSKVIRRRPRRSSSAASDSVPRTPHPSDSALALLDQYIHLMDPVALLKLLPPTIPLHRLSHIFSRLLPQTLHARRHGRVVVGLQKVHHLRIQTHTFALRSLCLPLDSESKCGWCGLALNESVFVAHPVHFVEDPIEGRYIIDYEHGGAIHATGGANNNNSSNEPTSALNKDGEEVGLRQQMPRYVLVHYKCSQPFVAAGGVDAWLGRTPPAATAPTSATAASSTGAATATTRRATVAHTTNSGRDRPFSTYSNAY